jgi:putative membrane protein
VSVDEVAIPAGQWRRLSPRMLLVHPVHEVLRQLPLLIGSVVLGYSTGNPMWSVAALILMVAYGVARWFTTAYRLDADQLQLRDGVLQRKVLSLPRNRIRSLSTDARLLHRVLGLTVVKVGTGQEAKGDKEFELDAVRSEELAGLRTVLLADAPSAASDEVQAADRVLARWQPTWLRYSPLSFTGLAMIAAAVGIVYQTGAVAALEDSQLARAGLDAAERFGVLASVALGAVAVVVMSVVLSVARSLVTFGNLVLTRRDDGTGAGVLHLEHGLLRVREHTFDVRRLRGGTLREPLLVRIFGGARLDAVMTGVGGAGEASLLLPPCPRATAEAVLTSLTGPDVVAGELRRHGPAAARRRWTRALAFPAVLAIGLAGLSFVVAVPTWVWVVCGVLAVVAALLAADRSRSLGHRVDGGWLVARAGSLDRRRDCIAAAGIIGWTVRQTLFQRRAGVATLVAATAAGVKGYRVLDVPADLAWSVAAAASPWVADNEWARVR